MSKKGNDEVSRSGLLASLEYVPDYLFFRMLLEEPWLNGQSKWGYITIEMLEIRARPYWAHTRDGSGSYVSCRVAPFTYPDAINPFSHSSMWDETYWTELEQKEGGTEDYLIITCYDCEAFARIPFGVFQSWLEPER